MSAYCDVFDVGDVTDEIIDIAWGIVEGWYSEGSIDWEDVWDRMESAELENGQSINMGQDLNSPAIKKIKKFIKTKRAQEI